MVTKRQEAASYLTQFVDLKCVFAVDYDDDERVERLEIVACVDFRFSAVLFLFSFLDFLLCSDRVGERWPRLLGECR